MKGHVQAALLTCYLTTSASGAPGPTAFSRVLSPPPGTMDLKDEASLRPNFYSGYILPSSLLRGLEQGKKVLQEIFIELWAPSPRAGAHSSLGTTLCLEFMPNMSLQMTTIVNSQPSRAGLVTPIIIYNNCDLNI